MRLPLFRISTGSHMSPLFSPDNAYYGISGEFRMCRNGLRFEQKEKCMNGYPVWFSAWGHYEPNKIHARLTWNPYYQQLENQLYTFVNQTLKVNDINTASIVGSHASSH